MKTAERSVRHEDSVAMIQRVHLTRMGKIRQQRKPLCQSNIRSFGRT